MHSKVIKDVVPGERVLSGDGVWHKVTDTATIKPYGPKYTLKLWGGVKPVEVTGNHPILTSNGFQRADTLKKGDKVLSRIDRNLHGADVIDMLDYFTRKQSEKKSNSGIFLGGVEVSKDGSKLRYKNPKARWVNRWIPVDGRLLALLGYYASEGSCGSHNVQWTFNSLEKTYQTEVASLVKDLFGLETSSKVSPTGTSTTVYVSSYPLREFFKEQVSGTAGEKCINELVTWADPVYQREFIRTYWNGDGSFHGNGYIFTTTSFSLMLSVRMILLRMGITSTLSTVKRKGGHTLLQGRRVNYNYDLLNLRVSIPEGVNALSELLGKDFTKSESAASGRSMIAKIAGDFLELTIKEVGVDEWSAEDTVTNLTVEGDHTFTLPGMTTHNCDSLAIGLIVAEEYQVPEVTTANNPFYGRN